MVNSCRAGNLGPAVKVGRECEREGERKIQVSEFQGPVGTHKQPRGRPRKPAPIGSGLGTVSGQTLARPYRGLILEKYKLGRGGCPKPPAVRWDNGPYQSSPPIKNPAPARRSWVF